MEEPGSRGAKVIRVAGVFDNDNPLKRMSDINDGAERSEGGSRIFRYDGSSGPQEFRMPEQDGEAIDALEQHLAAHLPGPSMVFHELVSDLVHIDVHIYSPTPERNCYTLVTTGMSDLPMNAPKGLEAYRFAEMMICLPSGWPITDEDLKDERNYWPIRWLKFLARFPHSYNAWLWIEHTLPNGDPPEPLCTGLPFTGLLLLSPVTFSEDFCSVHVRDDKAVGIHAMIPLYSDEMNFKLKHGVGALCELFAANGVTELLDPNRPSVCAGEPPKRKRRFFGLWG